MAKGTPFAPTRDADTTDGFNRGSYRQLVTPLDRKYASAGATVELSDSVEMFTEL